MYGHRGLYQVYPIEYKKGKPKDTEIDILQLTAQAMCLEEMLTACIEKGAVYYGEIKHRQEVTFTKELRERVRSSFAEMHQLFARQYTPKVRWSKAVSYTHLENES